ncbi:exodeoxyribonuclease-like [Oscarella lobularis]|uniref:exodeoxyribonuclease-like n=1 Tax=Oscarella lobularis TaxID=121494 RepID=UPI0033137B12
MPRKGKNSHGRRAKRLTDGTLNKINYLIKKNFCSQFVEFEIGLLEYKWVESLVEGQEYVEQEDPDVFCVQEIKCDKNSIPPEAKIKGYHAYWYSAEKKGYSGTGVFYKEKPLNVKYGMDKQEHNTEGRVLTLEYEKYYLVALYVPNSGRGLTRLDYRQTWDKDLRDYIKTLDEKKPVVVCGDLNVAHKEIDLANAKGNKKTAGFTKEEREGFTALLDEGFTDSFRHLYPDQTGAYTFWSSMKNARGKNVGWRLDYFVISKRWESSLCDHVIRSDVMGSDHCPIVLYVAI